MRAQPMPAEGGEVVRAARRTHAGLGIAYDDNVALPVDRQIKQARRGSLVMDGFDAGELAHEPHHGFG
jgi:hypothetical protein